MVATALHRMISSLPNIKGRNGALRLLAPYCSYAQSAYGPVLRVRPNDITNQFSLNGWYGYELHRLISALPRDGVFLDIGANTGVYALVAGRHLTQGRVFAFEPNPRIFGDLIDNIEKNDLDNVTAFNFGIGGETGLVDFQYRRDHSGSAAMVQKNGEADAATATALILSVDQIALAERLTDGEILCKIDVEGAEARVLTSLAESGVLERIDTVFVEIDREYLSRFGDDPDAIYRLMASHGFTATTDRRGREHYDEIFVAT